MIARRFCPPSLPFLAACSLAALLTAPLSAQSGIHDRAVPSPFAVLGEAPIEGTVAVSFDYGDYAELQPLHAAHEVVTLEGFALPDGERVDLVLRPISPMPAGGEAQVVGEHGTWTIQPNVLLFAGFVSGRQGHSFLSVSPSALNGYLDLDGERFYVSSANRTGSALVSDSDVFPASSSGPWCQAFDRWHRSLDEQGGMQRFVGPSGGPTAPIWTAEIFVELDHEYRALFASDMDASNYALTLFGAMGEIYRRDLGVMISIPSGYLRVWNVVPPWGVVVDFDNISDIQAWWSSGANPDQNLDRDLVHVFSNPVFGGVAYLPALCDYEFGYALSSVFGSFPYPIEHTSDDNWDLMVVSHETGHNFGSYHTFDYDPPIDCYDGSGPDDGTIMSYCHLEPDGLGQVGMRFHQRAQEGQLRPSIEAAGCLDLSFVAQGDYDLDGDINNLDLAAFDSVVNQGFYSTGVVEVFDLNGDGQVDACDRPILESLIAGELTLVLDSSEDPLLRGLPVTLTASNANPGETVYFLYSEGGVGCGPCPNKLGGMCLDLVQPIVVAAGRVANGSGEASLTTTVPFGFPAAEVGLQVVIRRGPGGVDSVKSHPKLLPVL